MKVLVIGGTGMFGSRLCELLARDGHDVTIASRRKPDPMKTPELASFAHVEFDRNGPLSSFDDYDVIADAAGPFHAYGDDPYRIAKAAIEAGSHYFDLCDNAAFCQGINVLEGAAKTAGVTVASGMSSVPAVSSAAVEALCAGQTPLMIETAILPGNKAPRGRAVVESILDQTGQTYVERLGGRDVPVRSWSGSKTYDLGEYRRQGWRIEVPDQRLFPDHFNCRSVSFRAGLELGMMRYGLGVLSLVRSKIGFGVPNWFVSLMMLGAKALEPFGTDRGAMVVDVTLPNDAGFIRKTWVMRAENGDGPYTPAIAIRAACRDLATLKSGAGPALSLVALDQIEACFDDLDIETEHTQQDAIPIFEQVLGAQFDTLPDVISATHNAVTPRAFKGMASVTRGTGLLARIGALLFGFPPSAQSVEVEVVKTPDGRGETWVRRFGTKTFKSFLRPSDKGMTERFGALTFNLGLQIQDGTLHFPVTGGRIGFIPIPRFMLPQSIASEVDKDGLFHFDVLLKAPTGATLIHYKGWLKPE
ncbi:Saccharopine dehydrogenase NADP binding domain-containing protein [Octadecabacter temperatus]|uniref:Saccharopine dehydrogenase n=1 Tax=Octadecabacter temperatus TaxID=1458307 RepID=A0A0K0Y1Z4_9RHOB|nr:SDR family oxidoreductase [Octadecabacter temperatus]AKS44932.1 Saccharopine dehydrogenase [Octadecabacter temperatus]SIN82954.1 Saccharopine dehydrogenase NADP binding domain-containing protein [Octadecabacter temperatus]